jgi:hypothetical protein
VALLLALGCRVAEFLDLPLGSAEVVRDQLQETEEFPEAEALRLGDVQRIDAQSALRAEDVPAIEVPSGQDRADLDFQS